jgi:glycine/serine hydroxymethyltransferase
MVNYQALPDDEAFTASSGLRTGVQEMTRFGMKEEDFAEFAEYMAAVILDEEDVSRKVSSFRKRFIKMQYCLAEEQAKPLVSKLVGALIKS